MLDLSYNLLGPECVLALRGLPALQSLDLSGNRFKTLPLGLTAGDYVALQDLILDSNELEAPVPFQALALLPALQYLSLSHNAIAYIPRLVHDEGECDAGPHATPPVFPVLRVLSITHNNLARSADVLNAATLEQLDTLHLWGNPISWKNAELPVEVRMELINHWYASK